MKTRFFALAALLFGMAACQTDPMGGLEVDANGEAAVTVSVALPEGATRAAGSDSARGAIDTWWNNETTQANYDIRFILEVYEGEELAKDRMVVCGDEDKATFNFRLVPGRNYKFVVWADFVNEYENGIAKDLHYNTNTVKGLRDVKIIDSQWTAIDESRDAYTAVVDVEYYSGASQIDPIILTRPFAKLRVVTNDILELNKGVHPTTVKVKYFSTDFYTSFNALEQKPFNKQTYSDHELEVDLTEDTYSDEKPEETGVQTLFADYFFAQEGDRVMFTMDVEFNKGDSLPQVVFNTNIPVKRNNLTTVYGPILTDANNVTVEINPAFENKLNPNDPPYYVEILSGNMSETIELTKSGSYVFEDLTVNADQAVVVKNGADVVIDIKGYAKLNGKQGIVVEDGATLTINGISKTRTEERAGNLVVVATEGSAIGGKFITINNLAGLTAKAGNGDHAFGIGGTNAEVEINNTKIDYVSGAYVQPLFENDEKYGKSEPEGGAAIGGKKVVIENSEVVKAEGGSKAAAIGNRFWSNTEVIIKNSTLKDVFGGNASAAIGGSRVNSNITAENKLEVKITIENSTIENAVGGQYGAGIGFGYDTHCAANDTNCVNNIVIIKSTITAQGGKYAAGIGTGFHTAALTGSIDAESVINATCGEDFYKNTYTTAQNIGYGIVDPEREFKDCNVTFTVAGNVISRPSLPVVGENGTIVEGLGKDIENENQYYISEPEALTYIADQVNEGNDNFNKAEIVLSNDIDLSQYAITRSAVASNWAPIGTSEKPFSGTFDGNGKTIKNLCIIESEAKEGKAYIGFFGYAKDATIKNVTFENVNINIACLDIDHSQGHIGAVAGSLEGTSTIEDVTVKGDIKVESTVTANGASRVAVVAGGNSYGNVTMKNVHVIANEGSYLKANNNVGALAGQLQGKSVFENCSSNIDVTGTKFFAGGIIGLAAGDQLFTNCHTTGDVTITAGRKGKAHDHYRVGGIAGGWADGATNVCTLTNCSYEGDLSGTNADGSVVEAFDYAGYVGRGYTLNNCQGSKVVIDGVEYVQAHNTAAEAGIYYVNGELVISTASALKVVATRVNNGTDYYNGQTIVLGADIDLNNQEWTPIGSAYADHGFMGNFDGNGFAVKNLKMTELAVDADGYVYAGLFGVTEGVDTNNQNYIKDLVIENVNIDTTGSIAAAAIAYPYYTALENIKVQGNVTIKGGDYTAGVLAYTRRCVDAKNISIEATNGSIEGNKTVGGVISDIQMNGGLTANYSNFAASGLTIKAVMSVGGISGIICNQTLNGATVKNVTIDCKDDRTGIVAGAEGGKSTIKNVVYKNVEGATRVIGATYDEGYYVGKIVEVAGQKAVIFSIEDGAKAVSIAEITLNGKTWQDAMDWAAGLGEGWALASMEELNAIYDLRCELNVALKADNAENALFWEGDELYIKNGSVYYANYMSSTEAPYGESDANGNAYFANRVFFKLFNDRGYSDVLYSAFDCINKYAPLKDNYFARAVYTF